MKRSNRRHLYCTLQADRVQYYSQIYPISIEYGRTPDILDQDRKG